MKTGNRKRKNSGNAGGSGNRESAGRLENKICALVGGLFMGTACQWGNQLDTLGNVNFLAPATWLVPLVIAAVAAPVLAWGFARLDGACRKRPEGAVCGKGDERGGKWQRLCARWDALRGGYRWLLTALALFVVWLPVFFAVYPGFFAYDATDELEQVMTGNYVTRHPLLHVLLLGKIVSGIEALTGSYNAGIAVYVLLQMTALALLLSWELGCLKKLGAGRRLRAISAVFLAFFPVIPMYVLCTSKDIWYTAGMLAVLTLLCLFNRAHGGEKDINGNEFFPKRYWFGLGAALFVMAVFRNNGFYVFLVMIPVLLLLAGKRDLRKMAAVAAVVLLAVLGTNAGLKAALHPVNTDVQETLTVPIQQLARTWKYSPEIFSEEERETLFEILPRKVLERYDPKLSDLVKIDFQTEKYMENPARYRMLWLKIGMKAPFTYVNAWLMTSYGFWYPFTVIDAYNGTRYYRESSYFSCETEPPGTRSSYLPLLEKIYQEISWMDRIHRIPVAGWLFSPGFMCWIFMLAGISFVAFGRWRQLGALMPVYLNWLTVLLGPACLVRYVLIFWFALPLLLVVINTQMCYTSKDNAKRGFL